MDEDPSRVFASARRGKAEFGDLSDVSNYVLCWLVGRLVQFRLYLYLFLFDSPFY